MPLAYNQNNGVVQYFNEADNIPVQDGWWEMSDDETVEQAYQSIVEQLDPGQYVHPPINFGLQINAEQAAAQLENHLNNVAPSFKKLFAFGSSRSSSKPQDPAYQIGESVKCLDQEMADLVGAKEEIATRLEVLEESCITIRDHISILRKVASQLETSYGRKRQSYQLKIVPGIAAAAPEIQQVGLDFEVEEQLAEPEPLQQGQG